MNKSENANPERGKTLVLVLTLLNMVLVAAISALQVDATIRANQANRDSQYYAVQVTGGLGYSGARSEYDVRTYTVSVSYSLKALMAEYSANQRQDANDQQGFEALTLDSQFYLAQANRATSLSVLQTNPAYGVLLDQGTPNYTAYMDDITSYSREVLQKQNDASDAYHRWNNKSDSYVAVLTVMAIAFFLLGVAQMTRPSLRLLFSLFAIGVIGIGSLWTLILLIF